MPWVKIDEAFSEHPKLAKVGPLGWGYWLAGLAYCNRNLTDGFIPRSVAFTLGSTEILDAEGTVFQLGVAGIPEEGGWSVGTDVDAAFVVELLCRAKVWKRVRNGYRVHGYLEYQPSKAQVLELREARRAAGAKGGKASSRAKDKQVLKQTLNQTLKQI